VARGTAGVVVLPHGPAVRDPYAGTAGFSWWKGQLHTHTARSFDGDPAIPPERRADQYRDSGYDFTVFTDHDKVSSLSGNGASPVRGAAGKGGQASGQSGRSFLAMPGVESTDPSAHLGVWLMGPAAATVDQPVIAADRSPVERMEAWAAAGALVCCNHPNHESAPLTPEQVASWAGAGAPFRFVEVFNTLAIRQASELAYNTEVWRRAVTAAGPDRPIWGVATDDSHGRSVGQGWISVAAPDLAPAALREALLAGRFYAGNGLAFTALGVDLEAGGIVAAAPGATSIRFIGDDGAVRHQSEGGASTYVPGSDVRWVRVEASDTAGRTAWSQPFWIES
jgi:hypothetical protein